MSVYGSLTYAFEPYLGPQTGRVLREGMKYLRLTLSSLDTGTILKRSVYHKLQDEDVAVGGQDVHPRRTRGSGRYPTIGSRH